jgi:hypothetical protein
VGDGVKVSAENVNCRTAPTLSSAVIKLMLGGTTGTIVGGPTSADGYTFWKVQYSEGTLGWSAGKYLVKAAVTPPPPPVNPVPSGTLEVSRIDAGFASAWFTIKDDTASVLTVPRMGILAGKVTFPLTRDTTITLELWNRQGSKTLTASTVNGSPLPATPDSAKIAQAAFVLGRASVVCPDSVAGYNLGYLRGFTAGKASVICPPPVVCPPVDSTAAAIKRALAPWLRIGQ